MSAVWMMRRIREAERRGEYFRHNMYSFTLHFTFTQITYNQSHSYFCMLPHIIKPKIYSALSAVMLCVTNMAAQFINPVQQFPCDENILET